MMFSFIFAFLHVEWQASLRFSPSPRSTDPSLGSTVTPFTILLFGGSYLCVSFYTDLFILIRPQQWSRTGPLGRRGEQGHGEGSLGEQPEHRRRGVSWDHLAWPLAGGGHKGAERNSRYTEFERTRCKHVLWWSGWPQIRWLADVFGWRKPSPETPFQF